MTGQQQKWRQRHQREGKRVDWLRLGVRLLTSKGLGCSCFDRLEVGRCVEKANSVGMQTCWKQTCRELEQDVETGS